MPSAQIETQRMLALVRTPRIAVTDLAINRYQSDIKLEGIPKGNQFRKNVRVLSKVARLKHAYAGSRGTAALFPNALGTLRKNRSKSTVKAGPLRQTKYIDKFPNIFNQGYEYQNTFLPPIVVLLQLHKRT